MNKEPNINVEVLLLTDEKNVFEENLQNQNIKVLKLNYSSIYNPINIYGLRKVIKKGKYDIVHVHLFPSSYWASIVARTIIKDKPKFIFTEHNTHNRRREKAYFRIVERVIYSRFNKVISISKKTQENLKTWLKVNFENEDKFTVIDNGIDIELFENAISYKKNEIVNSIDEDTKLLCMVGRFSAQKDQMTLIKAMKYLPSDYHLILIGEGVLINNHREMAKDLKVLDRVHFLGFRDDVTRIYKTADAIIMSSHWEGFGLAAVEGMASGKPVIASDVSGLRDIVEGAGLLFPPEDTQELVEVIKYLFNDENIYKQIKEICQDRANEYDIRKMVNRYLEVYKI